MKRRTLVNMHNPFGSQCLPVFNTTTNDPYHYHPLLCEIRDHIWQHDEHGTSPRSGKHYSQTLSSSADVSGTSMGGYWFNDWTRSGGEAPVWHLRTQPWWHLRKVEIITGMKASKSDKFNPDVMERLSGKCQPLIKCLIGEVLKQIGQFDV